METMDNKFKIACQLDLVKSQGQDDDKGVLIHGRVLASVKDVAGETPILKDMDWSYLEWRADNYQAGGGNVHTHTDDKGNERDYVPSIGFVDEQEGQEQPQEPKE
jgi:hypothetical protein